MAVLTPERIEELGSQKMNRRIVMAWRRRERSHKNTERLHVGVRDFIAPTCGTVFCAALEVTVGKSHLNRKRSANESLDRFFLCLPTESSQLGIATGDPSRYPIAIPIILIGSARDLERIDGLEKS
jgi:hypothetical protein